MGSARLLVFSPYAAIWDHVLPEMQIAEAAAMHRPVRFLTCEGFMENYCIAMHAFRLYESSSIEEKRRVCDICREQDQMRRTRPGLDFDKIESFLTKEDLQETQKTIDSLTAQTFLDFEFLNVPVGRFSIYEYLLSHKKNNSDFSEKEWKEVSIPFENCLNVLKALQRYWQKHPADRVLIYNTLYSVNAVVTHFAKQQGALVYFLHHGMSLAGRDSDVMLGHNSTLQFLKKSVRHWPEYRERALGPREQERVTQHILEIMRGKSVFAYSAQGGDGRDIAQVLGIPDDKKVIVVSMSSGDERFGIEITGHSQKPKALFANQVEWAEFILNWARERRDVFVIFRVHPREFPNKRESVTSMQALELKKLFANLPVNVVVNWPDQNISLYDLAEYADVFLNAWSSVGKEMALFGFPVVIYSKDLLWYPAEINYLGETKGDYLKAIDKALLTGWSVQHAISAYRWMNLEISASHLPLKKKMNPEASKWVRRVLRRISKTWLLKYDLWCLDFRDSEPAVRELFEKAAEGPLDIKRMPPAVSPEIEIQTLKTQYMKIRDFLYPEGKKRKPGGLYDRMGEFLT